MDAKILDALKTVIELANSRVEDIETGLEDNTYRAEDNPDIEQHAAAVKLLEEFVASGKATEIPVVALTVDGTVHCVVSDIPVRVIAIDNDIECGGEPENFKEVFGDEVYVTDITVTEYGSSGQSGVQPDYIDRLLTWVDAETAEDAE